MTKHKTTQQYCLQILCTNINLYQNADDVTEVYADYLPHTQHSPHSTQCGAKPSLEGLQCKISQGEGTIRASATTDSQSRYFISAVSDLKGEMYSPFVTYSPRSNLRLRKWVQSKGKIKLYVYHLSKRFYSCYIQLYRMFRYFPVFRLFCINTFRYCTL